jgi:hypothetical protein
MIQKVRAIAALACLLSAVCAEPQDSVETSSAHRHYRGRIGADLDVEFDIAASGTDVGGFYLYARIGVPIRLKGGLRGKTLSLAEEGGTGSIEAVMEKDGSVMTGSWRSPDGKRRLPLVLCEDYSASAEFGIIGISMSRETGDGSVATFRGTAPYPRGNGALALSLDEALYGDGGARRWLESSGARFLDECEIEAPESDWAHETNVEVAFNSNDILCLSVAEYDYSGGAHPNFSRQYLVFSLLTGKRLGLFDFVRQGSEESLSRLVTESLARAVGLKPGKSLSELGFFVDRVPASVDNFFVDGAGLRFHYPAYEICPYAMGERTVLVAWADCADILKASNPFRR